MAALTAEARAARVYAQRLRRHSKELKLKVHGNVARSRMRLEKAQVEAERARMNRDEPLPSPWSELSWTQRYGPLEQTLVPLPSERARADDDAAGRASRRR